MALTPMAMVLAAAAAAAAEEEEEEEEVSLEEDLKAEVDDVRSIEAEKVGDEDEELDAWEREFLLQQEARQRHLLPAAAAAASSALAEAGGDDEDDDDGVASPGCHGGAEDPTRAESPPRREENEDEEFRVLGHRAAAAAAASRRARQQRNSTVRSSGIAPRAEGGIFIVGDAIARCAAADDDGVERLILFPELDSSGTVDVGQKGSAEVEEGNKRLRLGSASNSGKQQSNASTTFQRRNIVSGSSSKVSVRTATSLERQYSTGSTSTVESPNFVGSEISGGGGGDRPATRKWVSPGVAPRLTFSFPGWGVDMSKGEKHSSVVSHQHAENATESLAKRSRQSARGKSVADEWLGDSSPVCDLPDEILLQVMRRLEILDLCSTIQTCKRWYRVGQQDDLWNQFVGDADGGLLSDSSSEVLPRWLCKKNSSLLEGVRVRFNVFSKGYNYLRRALHEWWEIGLHRSRYNSQGIYSLIRKLTGNDWSLLYEALGVTFTDRADRVAVQLLRRLRPAPLPTGRTLSEPTRAQPNGGSMAGGETLSNPNDNPKFTLSPAGRIPDFDAHAHWKSGAVSDGIRGKELWRCLLKFWKRYRPWLLLISTHCPDLNHEVRLERARSMSVAATPTLFDKGLICFRSQVVLKYGIRSVLQAGFMFLSAEDARDRITEPDADLLRSAHHLLQELDVADDFTLPQKSHTQTKLRQCFRSALTTNSKLALHMNDKRKHL